MTWCRVTLQIALSTRRRYRAAVRDGCVWLYEATSMRSFAKRVPTGVAALLHTGVVGLVLFEKDNARPVQ